MHSIVKRSLLAGVVAGIIVALPAGAAISRFTDVPDTNVFVEDIEWLADAGVTSGCNPPSNDQFCPSAVVTREQMAAFLRRLAEGEVVNAATALTADNAGTAGHATSADTAALADSAGSADTAATAGHATTADSATTAASADTATTAGSAADSELLAGRGPGTYDTFVIGNSVGAADQGGQLTICYEEQLPFCSEWSSEGALLAEASFTTAATDSAVAVTGATTLASLNGNTTVSTYVWLQLDSSVCFDSINAASTAAYVRQTLPVSGQEVVSVTAALEIPTPGAHTVTLCAQPFAGNVAVLASSLSGVVSGSPNNSTSVTLLAP